MGLIVTVSIITLSILTLGRMTLTITGFIEALSIMSLISTLIITPSLMGLTESCRHNDTQYFELLFNKLASENQVLILTF